MKGLFIGIFLLLGLNCYSQAFCMKDCEEIVVATVYNATPSQCNNDPIHTASMYKLDLTNPYKHRIIAVSRDLLKKFPMGTIVFIKGTSYDGLYQVQDKMNKRYKKKIDILINKDMKIGKWSNVKIIKKV